MSSPSPEGLLNRPLLRRLAGDKFFASGEECFVNGRVRSLHVTGDRVTARVTGSRAYRVDLWRGRGELRYSCNCAVGREETFCKHCVAVGLAWLAGPDGMLPPTPSREDSATREASTAEKDFAREQLQRHLRVLDKERLIGLLLEATDYDDILRRRLLLESIGVSRTDDPRRHTVASASAPDFEAYRELLREAIACSGYVDYDAMPEYAQGIEEAIFPFGELLRTGHAAVVIDLAEFALIELDKANEMVDGGDGALNAVYDDLQHYHLEACRAAQPDPEELAGRLLEYELEGGLAVFNNAVKTYAEVLGVRGTAAWRHRLEREWSKLPRLVQRSSDQTATTRQPIDHRRFQLQALMERLAESTGDFATLAAVKQRDLSSAHDFLSLAELYLAARQPEQALAWAERGLRAFPGLPDRVGLRDFVASGYHRQGRHEDAVGLVWEEFEVFSDLDHYRKLQAHAQQGDPSDWLDWRERALTHLRGRRTHGTGHNRASASAASADSSALVEILLSDGAEDVAWTEACAAGCRPDLWMQLAGRREQSHPEDALHVYQQRLGPIVARGGQHSYREALELLTQIRALFIRLGRAAEFDTYRAELRAAHRHKRQFVKLLDSVHD